MMQSKTDAYQNNSKKIISVGRLEWQKGYDRLISIWNIVSPKHPDWSLTIFGSGTLENELKTIIKSKGLKNITIHPFTSNINKEYSQSSIFVQTSHFEGFPLVLIEALQHGLPCVVFDCPYGPKDIIENNQCGYVVENNNIQQYAEKLCELMNSNELRKTFSMNGKIKADTYNIDTIMKTWNDLFISLML